jgi:hypothetical protein
MQLIRFLLVAAVALTSPFASAALPQFRTAGSLQQTRASHTATLLGDGTTLIAGGSTGTTYHPSAELYLQDRDSVVVRLALLRLAVTVLEHGKHVTRDIAKHLADLGAVLRPGGVLGALGREHGKELLVAALLDRGKCVLPLDVPDLVGEDRRQLVFRLGRTEQTSGDEDERAGRGKGPLFGELVLRT